MMLNSKEDDSESRLLQAPNLLRLCVAYVILLRVLRPLNPTRAKNVILLGHAEDTESYIFQNLIRIRDRSAKKIQYF